MQRPGDQAVVVANTYTPGDFVAYAVARDNQPLVNALNSGLDAVIADVGHDAARAVNETISGRGAVGLYVRVSNVELVVPAVADADVIVPLRKTFYGMHEITVREPGGHAVTFASELPAAG